ncbi:hypothetical protein D3C80_1248590 [compost metagenome]
MLMGIVQRLTAGRIHTISREMSTGNQQRLTGRDERLIDVFRRNSHIGAVVSVKNQRKSIAVLDAQHR